MSMVGFPLLLIPLAIYNIIVFLMPGVSLAEPLVTLPIPTSGAQWPVTLSDVLVALGILMLLFEVIKGARPGAKYLTDHLLSFIVLGGAVAEFLLWPRFATSTFFLLTLLAMVDFFAGVSLHVRRGAPAAVSSGRGSRRAPATEAPMDIRHEPVVPHTGPSPLVEEGPREASSPAHSESVHSESLHSESPALSEPKFAHPETTGAPASEVPAVAPHADDGSQPR